MKALVTGCAGFIGGHLCRALLREGYHVTGVDSFLTGTRRTVEDLATDARFTFVEADVAQSLPVAGPVDIAFHFASPASPIDYAQSPIETLRANSAGTQMVADYARACGARVVYASTSEVYGDPLQHPQCEAYWGNVNPNGVRSCYDESKRYGEALLFAYHRTYALDIRIARIFNTYGPNMRMNDGRVIPSFLSSIVEGRPLVIFGDGKQTRSLCYVDDLVDGILAFARIERPAHRVVNLGNDREVTVLEIARVLCDVAGVALQMEHRPLPSDDPTRRKPDLTLARTMLGFEPHIDLHDGLSRTFSALARPYEHATS